ncbi:hypothetical protein [Pseudomonas sp. NPDC089534]|uniref:hypothetical protein n=1 Tax=Pseudomonas sp. NPDC089534 TaxID=3364468 RepID=UPI00381A458D
MNRMKWRVGASLCAMALSALAGNGVSDEQFEDMLQAGHWSVNAEDNASFYKEQVPAATIRKWVDGYRPSDPASASGIGLLVLTSAVAEWGVKSDEPLPEDPHKKAWQGPGVGSDGKHLISYAVGGIGINHTDSGELVELFDYLKRQHPDLAPHADAFFRLRGVNYDRVRANGGVCTTPRSEITVDLDGKPFGHNAFGGGASYCATYRKGSTTREDWQVFRHWMRAALREKDVQRYIIDRWLAKVWVPSFEHVTAAGGSVEEAMINARIRNSSPGTAECALKRARDGGGDVDARIAAELSAYVSSACKGNPSHERRFGSMKRPVVLFRQFR